MIFRISGKKNAEQNLGLFLDENLSFKYRPNCFWSKIRHYVRSPYLEQYTLLFLIHIPDMDVKSGDRIKIMLSKTLKNYKKKQREL